MTARCGGPLILLAAGLLLMAQGSWVPAKAALAQVLLSHAFDRCVALSHPVKPWPWADTWPVARIEVPRLGISRIALAGGSGQALAFGPSRIAGSGGTTVFAGHRDTHFAFLRDLHDGDMIRVVGTDGHATRYLVAGHEVTRWDRFMVDPAAPGSRIALVTCWPFGALRHGPERYVVWAVARA